MYIYIYIYICGAHSFGGVRVNPRVKTLLLPRPGRALGT